MIQLKTVRESFSLPLIMLLSVLTITGLIVCAFLIINWGLYIYPEPIPDIGIIIALAVEGIQEILPPATLLALAFAILRYRRKPGIRLLSLFLLFSFSSILFMSAGIVLPGLMKKQPAYKLPLTVDEGFIHSLNDNSIFVGTQAADTLEHVLVLDSGKRPAFTYRKELTIAATSSGTEGQFYVSPCTDIFTPPRFILDIVRDAVQLNRNIRNTETASFRIFVINGMAMVFFVFSGCLLLTLPRWPLYNGILVLFGFRLFLYLAPFLWKTDFQQIAGLVIQEKFIIYSPAAVFLTFGSVFLLCTGLFRIAGRKEPERMHV